MDVLNNRKGKVIVAGLGGNGEFDFTEIEANPAACNEQPGVFEGMRHWQIDGPASLYEDVGYIPAQRGTFPAPGGSWAGFFCFRANSAGKHEIKSTNFEAGIDGDKSMHRTDSIDYEYIISGKVDYKMPGGKVKTLHAGDLLIVHGAPHAWSNPYDEDCVYLAVVVGANPPKEAK